MSHKRSILKASAAGLTVAALVSVGTGSAQADPTPDGSFRTYAAVGSDTTQDVWNGLTNGDGPLGVIGSYNAFPTDPLVTTIKTKANGATFNRPAGSGNGVRALSAVWDPTYTSHNFQGTVLVKKEVDFARSSSGPTAGSGLTYLPFARDAVSVAVKLYADGSGPTGLKTAQLAAIYGGPDDNTPGSGVAYDAATGLPKISGKILHPKLPQNGSGTRSFFQAAIGITTDDLASYVEPTASTLPENNGTVLTDEGDLIPFSAAQWIGQKNGVAAADTTTGLRLANINGLLPTAGTAPNMAPGSLFGTKDPQGLYSTVPGTGVGVFNRDTYNVVPTAFLTGTSQQLTLVKKLTGTAVGQVGSGKARTIIKKYGFGNLGYLGNDSFYRSGQWLH